MSTQDSQNDVDRYIEESLAGEVPEEVRERFHQTQQAFYQRIRKQDEKQPVVESTSGKACSFDWKFLLKLPRLVAGLIVISAITGLIVFFATHDRGNSAFAQLLQRVDEVRTVTFTVTVTSPAKEPGTTRVSMDDSGRIRAEHPDGSLSISNVRRGEVVSLDRNKKTAIVMKGMKPQPNLFEILRKHRKNGKPIGKRVFEGVKTNGFAVDYQGEQFTVWADTTTDLPVRIEQTKKDAEDQVWTVVVSDFIYDKPMDDALFDMSVPKDYTIESMGGITHDQLKPPPSDEEAKELVITPLVGIGKAKFGSSKEQVIEALGQPDDIQFNGLDHRYLSKGLAVAVFPKHGMLTVKCFSKAGIGPFAVNDFSGKTDKGIAIGSSRAQIEIAYGKPDKITAAGRQTVLQYEKLKADFVLLDDEVVEMSFIGLRTNRTSDE